MTAVHTFSLSIPPAATHTHTHNCTCVFSPSPSFTSCLPSLVPWTLVHERGENPYHRLQHRRAHLHLLNYWSQTWHTLAVSMVKTENSAADSEAQSRAREESCSSLIFCHNVAATGKLSFVLLLQLWRKRRRKMKRGGGGAFLSYGHWLLFCSSGTIMRFFFCQNISAAIQAPDCVYEIVLSLFRQWWNTHTNTRRQTHRERNHWSKALRCNKDQVSL